MNSRRSFKPIFLQRIVNSVSRTDDPFTYAIFTEISLSVHIILYYIICTDQNTET